MHRRDFLKYMISAPIAAATFVYGNPFQSILGLAQGISAAKVLVVIFQRGGCDGLNTIIPYGDSEYYNLRPGISIAPPTPGNAQSALDLVDPTGNQNGLFGMHPELSPLHGIYQQGTVAVLPAVHYDNASRSHFDGQDYIESGASSRLPDGWLNRYLGETSQGDKFLRGVGFGSSTPHSLRGEVPVSTFSDLNSFVFSDSELTSKLENVYSQIGSAPESYHSKLLEKGDLMLKNLNTLSQIDTENYFPENGAVYPSSSYGTQLRQTAQLIKENVGLEVATVSIGGYDNHSNQGGATGSQANRHADFAGGIAALYNDLGSRMDDVLILTMSEFGRTAKENASGGSDHGNAAAYFVIGNKVNGGIYGDWPGLQESDLYRGRYLAHNIDFRNVMGEVVDRHFQQAGSIPSVLPNHSYQPTGFLPTVI